MHGGQEADAGDHRGGCGDRRRGASGGARAGMSGMCGAVAHDDEPQPAELALERDLSAEVATEIATASRTEHAEGAEAPVRWVDRVFGSRLAQAAGAVVFVAVCLGLLIVTSSSMSALTGMLPSAGAGPLP